MRTVTVSRNQHGLIQFSFDAETARNTGFAAFTMEEWEAVYLGDSVRDVSEGTPISKPFTFIGIVHDGGEVVIDMSGASEI